MRDAASTVIPDTGAANAASAAAGKPSRARRIAHVLVALLVFIVLPMVLVGALVGEFGAGGSWRDSGGRHLPPPAALLPFRPPRADSSSVSRGHPCSATRVFDLPFESVGLLT